MGIIGWANRVDSWKDTIPVAKMIFDIERWSFFVFDLEDMYFLIT